MPDQPPPFASRPTVHSMPENPKIVGLSNAGFRLYIETICWCSRQETDGKIPEAAMKRLGRSKTVSELIEAGLIVAPPPSYVVHDYLEHQRSAREIAAFRASKAESGMKGAHMRWHIPTRKWSKDCLYCNGKAAANV
jgi:hypothetical protein